MGPTSSPGSHAPEKRAQRAARRLMTRQMRGATKLLCCLPRSRGPWSAGAQARPWPRAGGRAQTAFWSVAGPARAAISGVGESVSVSPSEFKRALSHWASGVAVITTRAADGEPVGLTATSFASLSLEPPLVLFCLGVDSTGREAFVAAQGFAVHMLHEDQEALSNRFATKGGDKFVGLEWSEGRWGAPLLPGCLAVLECRTHTQVPEGDHIIMVGAVEGIHIRGGAPLLYFGAAYHRAVSKN